jgi:hypothetical protein
MTLQLTMTVLLDGLQTWEGFAQRVRWATFFRHFPSYLDFDPYAAEMLASLLSTASELDDDFAARICMSLQVPVCFSPRSR